MISNDKSNGNEMGFAGIGPLSEKGPTLQPR